MQPQPPGAPVYPPRPVGPGQPGGAPQAPLPRPPGPGQQPGYPTGPVAGPYANGPSAAAPPAAPGVQPQLAGQMQGLKLGPAPGGLAPVVGGPRPVPPQRPAMPGAVPGARPPPGVVPGARPPGMQPVGPPGPPGAAGLANGVAGAMPPQRPAGPPYPAAPRGPGMAPPGAPVGVRPPGVQPGVPPAGPRPAATPGGAPLGAPLGPRPPAMQPPAAQSAALPSIAPGMPQAAGVHRPAAGFSTPTKQPPPPGGAVGPTSPPPFSLKVGSSTPSPTKVPPRPGMVPAPGYPQQQPGPGYPQQPPPMQQAAAPPMPGGAGPMRPPYGAPPGPPGMMAPGMMPPGPPGLHHPPGPPGAMHHPPGQLHGMPPPAAPVSGTPSSSKIDPSQIPRPLATPLPTQVFDTRRENTHAIPPPADAPIVVKDKGSAGPRYLRSLLNMVPQTADILKHSCLPFVVMINPLALPDPNDDPIEVSDFGEAGPVRCQRCKAYVNPFMKFVDGGRKMQCNFCGTAGDVPPDYFCHLGPDGQRRDKYERPELCKGTVELVATKEYMVRPPMPPVHFFLIDVSHPAVSSGATAAVCSSVAKILRELPGGERTEVCVATFDSTIHFYSLRPHQSQPHMLVVPDVTDVYCPLAGNVVVNLKQSLPLVESLLESIPRMFASTQVMETCGGAALRSAVEALKGGAGGKVHAFLSSLPRRGVLALRQRDLGRAPTDRDNMDALLPENKDYQALALDAAEHQVCIDLFFLSQAYCDVATLSLLPTTTCGSIYLYQPFDAAQDADTFYNDLRWNVIRPQGLEAVGRLRASHGLSVDKYIGPYYKRTLTDLNFPAISSDHCIAAKLVHEDKLPETGEVYLQFALLYTTLGGERRIRLHTLALPVTHSLGTTFRGADLDTYMAYVAKKIAMQIPGHALGACKEAINKSATDALHAYRKQCASASSSGQLILPEALKLLPLYTLALTKAPCFRTDAKLDARALWMWRLMSVPVPAVVPMIYPRLLALHTLLDRPENAPLVPEKLWVSAEKLDTHGVYLLENGYEAYVFVGKAASAETCMAILGVPSVEVTGDFNQPPLLLPALDNPLSRKIHQLLDEIRRQRCSYMRLRVVRRGDPALEPAFFSALVEDRSPSGGMSYVEFLCYLHRQIQNKLS